MLFKSENIPTIKVVLIGDSEQKKNFRGECIKQSPSNQPPAIGLDFIIVPGKSEKLNFQIWGTGGQERFQTLSEGYYKNSDIFIHFDNANNYANHAERIKKYKINVFEFNLYNLGPIEFLGQLEESLINYPSLKAGAINQAITIQKGLLDKDSPLSQLPKEISYVIAAKLFNQYAFFAYPLRLAREGLAVQEPLLESSTARL
ncbi:Ras family protein [Legionella massiliensis]|uniref:Ras family protein n=1 Tax=Legionella massiliensis TaxID=1034943 RepID=A0A078L3E2_9GAMM|nr:hypothetical protein [Legionella massiliensis]CDZ78458.1 Ras family protein [Legionella massiliensis]CEE14196.1 Ras family protein [Legionella massiliensis]